MAQNREIDMDICNICLDSMCESETYIKLSCKHKFHLHCIIMMGIKSPKFNECPVCRKSFQMPNVSKEMEDESKNIRKENEVLKADMDELHREARQYIDDAEQLADELLHRVRLVQHLRESMDKKDDKIDRLKTKINMLETENNELRKKQLAIEEERDNLSEVVKMFETLISPVKNHELDDEKEV